MTTTNEQPHRRARRIAVWAAAGLLAILVALWAIGMAAGDNVDDAAAEPAESVQSEAPAATPTPTPSSTPTPSASPTPTASPTPSPTPTAAPLIDQLRETAGLDGEAITNAEEPQPGWLDIETSIVDPRGDNGSLQAIQAIQICEAGKYLGYERVNVFESDGTHFVLAGHPTYGPECTEV
jgi:hypothetical protein